MARNSKATVKSSQSPLARLSVLLMAALGAAVATFAVMTLQAQGDGRSLPRFERDPARAEAEILINQFTAAEFCGHDTPEVRQKFNEARRVFTERGILDAKEFRDFRHRAITLAERRLAEEGPEGFQSWCGRQREGNANFFISLTGAAASTLDASW